MSTLREDILFCRNQGSLYTRECVGDASSSLYLVVAAFPSYSLRVAIPVPIGEDDIQ
jgi:hypothetical protein